MHADTEHISPLRLRELEQHALDGIAMRRQHAALLKALDVLVEQMRMQSVWSESQHWADRLAAEVKKYKAHE